MASVTHLELLTPILGMQVADEHGLETQLNMPQAGTAVPAAAQQQAAKPDADLSERLAQLRGK